MTPFEIFELAAGGGVLALSPMPGRTRHYPADWPRLLAWKPDLVLTMCAGSELARKGAGSLGDDLAASGIAWRHLPAEDWGLMAPQVAARWPAVSVEIRALLARRGRVLVHCHAGCGRAGMAVLRLMVEMGEDGEAALERLRQVRPCAVEAQVQKDWAFGLSR